MFKKTDRPDRDTDPRPEPTNPAQGISFLGASLVAADEKRRDTPPPEPGQAPPWRSHYW